MFTGMIETVGRVAGVRPAADGLRLEIHADRTLEALTLGESIAVDGVCLTVVQHPDDRRFSVDVSSESVDRTTIGKLGVGDRVNLERALRLGDRLGGHLVSGHVDARGRLAARTPAGESLRLRFEVPAEVAGFLVPKGSVAVNGVSLTINELDGVGFAVNVIPHTSAETNLEGLAVGAGVNIEVDMLAKMVHRMLGAYRVEDRSAGDISLDLLARSGFMGTPSGRGGGRK